MAEQFDEQLLLAYVEGELDAADVARVQGWLREDARLASLVESMIADRDALRQMPAPQAPPWLMDEVNRQLERDMLMDGVPQEAGPIAMPHRPVLRSIFTGGAVAAMLAIVGGLIAYSITDVNPAREFAQQIGLIPPTATTTVADATTEAADGEPAAPLAEADDGPPALADAGLGEAAGSAPEADSALAGAYDLDLLTMAPPSISSRLEPHRPQPGTLVDDSFDRIAAAEAGPQMSADDLQQRRLGQKAARDYAPMPELLADAEHAAESIAAGAAISPLDGTNVGAQPMTQAKAAEPLLQLSDGMDTLLDPLAVSAPHSLRDHPTQVPSISSALSKPLALDLPYRLSPQQLRTEPIPDFADASMPLANEPLALRSAKVTAPTTLRSREGFDAPAPKENATRVQLRALLEQRVLPHQLQLRIEADPAVAMEHLQAFGKVPEAATDAEAPTRLFELAIVLDRLEALIDALEQDDRVTAVHLTRQQVLAAGEIPGRPRRDTTFRELWPSLVPDYEAVLRHSLPEEPAEAPPVPLPVRIAPPAVPE
ncbi:MAG: hypothetical protein WD294_07770 [Phycisphaeraceae bacterium]